MPKKQGTTLKDIANLIAEFRRAYPNIKDLITNVVANKNIDPNEIFNKAYSIIKQHLENDPYYILGVSRDDPPDLIREIYYTKAKYYHPDKGGDEEKFRKLNQAYKKINP